MNERFEKIYEIAEREGWAVSHTVCQGEISFEFSKLSPAGQDFCFTRDVDYEDDEDYVLNEEEETGICKDCLKSKCIWK